MNAPPPDSSLIGPRIEPVAYRPPSAHTERRVLPRLSRMQALFGLAALIGLLAAWFLLTARAIEIRIEPEADRVALEGGFEFALGGRILVRPGGYTLSAEKQGYRPLRAPLIVSSDGDNVFRFTLEKLPGLLALTSTPDAELSVDGKPAGRTPQAALELAAGTHKLVFRAPRHEVLETDLTIEGMGIQQSFDAKLVPAWAPVSFSTAPAGAQVSVDGEAVSGQTPLTTDIGAGAHAVNVKLAGYKNWSGEIKVIANTPQTVPKIVLVRADGHLRLTSTPAGASVTVDGAFRGVTPLSVDVSPDKTHALKISKAGHATAERSAQLASDETRSLDVRLDAVVGQIDFSIQPADAVLSINGEAQPPGTKRLQLPAAPQEIGVTREGYASFKTTVTPRPGFDQRVDVVLKTEAQLRADRVPKRVSSAGGPQLVLIQPGSFIMGSERGSQGRQANEAQRPVKLTRAFYMSTTEITNAQFRSFDANYSSGIVGRRTLDNDTQPVVRISWDLAARYCNWLSAKDGLTPAYTEGAGAKLIEPRGTGYRLPTEAEWEYAARFAGRAAGLRYPWGVAMPVPERAGNFADKSASTLVTEHLQDYEDGFPASAAVASFPANPLGIFDLGGNVAEWVHDFYGPVIAIGGKQEVDPIGPGEGGDHVIRGSSWMHGRITELRLAYRDHGTDARQDVGFRIARYAESAP